MKDLPHTRGVAWTMQVISSFYAPLKEGDGGKRKLTQPSIGHLPHRNVNMPSAFASRQRRCQGHETSGGKTCVLLGGSSELGRLCRLRAFGVFFH